MLDLAVTVANVSGDAGSEDADVTSGQPVPGYNLSLNGGRPGGTSILADGVNNTGVGIGRAVVSFTPETVQEFTVQTSAYSAEYGNTSGGVINVTGKTGNERSERNCPVVHAKSGDERTAVPHRHDAADREQSSIQPGVGNGRRPDLSAVHRRPRRASLRRARPVVLFLCVRAALAKGFCRDDDAAANSGGDDGRFSRPDAYEQRLAAVIGRLAVRADLDRAGGDLSAIHDAGRQASADRACGGNQYCQFGDTRFIAGTAAAPQCTAATNATPIDAPECFADLVHRSAGAEDPGVHAA